MEYFKELLNKPSLFQEERKLDMNFIPDELPHRDKELSLLSQLFLTLITNPNSISRKILITGKTGIGKTATVKVFGGILQKISKERNVVIKYVHINCRKERTSYKVLIKIIRLLNKNFPKRGYSPQDLLEILTDFLNQQDVHILIVLDELNYLINKGEDLIYFLTRINDDSINTQERISIIGIVRDISCLNNLDYSTVSSLQRNIIKFSNYSKEQIFDILKYRACLSLKKNVISDDLIKLVVESTYINGDIRNGLNILWKATKIAEGRDLKHINSESIRLGSQDLVPFSTLDVLKYMSSQKLFFLLAIIKGLKKRFETNISFVDILRGYQMICENYGLHPRSNSQLWNYLQEFKRERIDLLKLEKIVVEILQSKGLSV